LAAAFGAGAVLSTVVLGTDVAFFTVEVFGLATSVFAFVAAGLIAVFFTLGFLAVADFAGVFFAGFAFWAS
jgi:hypothetical protein